MQIIAAGAMAIFIIITGVLMTASEVNWKGVTERIEKRREAAQRRKITESFPEGFKEIRNEWNRYLYWYEYQHERE